MSSTRAELERMRAEMQAAATEGRTALESEVLAFRYELLKV